MCVYCVSKVWCVSMQKCLVFNLKSKFVLFFIMSCGLFLSSTWYITPAMLTYIRTNLNKEALRLLPFKLSNPHLATLFQFVSGESMKNLFITSLHNLFDKLHSKYSWSQLSVQLLQNEYRTSPCTPTRNVYPKRIICIS